ncbi:MAG: ribosome-associated translation inhibitor RaiA [Alcanivoracaceae bacterium]|nr:ribosome-associated translation inhibitor RaiA [Alcanivoracaceae bacterium]
MQIDITGHQLDVTTSMKDYFNSKFERIKRHFDQVINVHAILSVEKINHKAEATMHINGKTLFAESVEEDLYAAIDLLIDKLDKQVRRHKDKITSKHRGEALKYNNVS